MNSMLLPEMSGLLEPALAVLAIVAPLGLAYALLCLPQRGPERDASSGPDKSRCGKLDS